MEGWQLCVWGLRDYLVSFRQQPPWVLSSVYSFLEGELQEGAWIVCPAAAPFVFDPRPDTLWRRVLRARGGPYAQLAELPPDPSWN